MKLHIKAKVISIHAKMDVLDAQENLVYKVSSKAISIHDKTYIEDAQGKEIAYVHAKAISIHRVHYVEMADGTNFEIKMELLHPLKNVLDIEELGWQIKGEILAHDYSIVDLNGNVLATAHRKWISLHNIYYLDIMDDSKADMIVAAYIVLEHIIAANEASSSGAAYSNQNQN